MTTMAMEIARERQLDWLLGEVLGGDVRAACGARVSRPWLAAALIVLGAGVAFGVAALHDRDGGDTGVIAPIDSPVAPQEREAPIPWIECHGEAQLGDVPTDVTALRCFDFTDAGLAALARFGELTHLDLSGMDVDARGASAALQITDAGVAELATLTSLRWLSLASCPQVHGQTFAALRAIPRLEHLDLTYSGMLSEGVAQLPQLPSLRELVLSHCMEFHGRSLADVAKLPGLRRLELRGCATLAADDVKQLAALHELRYLDLRDCMGAFRGQTEILDDITNGEPPAQPKQDLIGVTDEAVAALVGLPLETLRLDGCRSLTDGVAGSLRQMLGLRVVGLGELPEVTAATYAALPRELRELTLDGCRNFSSEALTSLAQLRALEVLSLTGCETLTGSQLLELTLDKPLRVLRLGGFRRMGQTADPSGAFRPRPTGAVVAAVFERTPTLQEVEASYSDWFDADVAAAAAALPDLRSLDFEGAVLSRETLAALGASRSLRSLRLVWTQGVDVPALDELGQVPLQDLDLYGCSNLKLKDMGLFESWPGVRVRLPEGARYVEPARPGAK